MALALKKLFKLFWPPFDDRPLAGGALGGAAFFAKFDAGLGLGAVGFSDSDSEGAGFRDIGSRAADFLGLAFGLVATFGLATSFSSVPSSSADSYEE